MRHNEDDFLEIYEQLFTTQGDVPGKPPAQVPIYASTLKLVNGSGHANRESITILPAR